MPKEFKPGERLWWIERDDSGELVHLTLVEVVGKSPWADGHVVFSVRSRRRYFPHRGQLHPLDVVRVDV